MIEFILNNESISCELREGMTVLDFIRNYKHLKGTKIGCREGDCGACTVLIGRIIDGDLSYESVTSCLTPLINAHGNHIVTIEGLALKKLNVAQNKLIEHNGAQCGFCTPGFVVSMMSDFLNTKNSNACAIDGNICRCTGYKSIELAYKDTKKIKASSLPNNYTIDDLVANNLVPLYFKSIKERLLQLDTRNHESIEGIIIGGGTDLLVQTPHIILNQKLKARLHLSDEKLVQVKDDKIIIKGSATASDLLHDKTLHDFLPSLGNILKLVSSTPIRNMGTIAGNIVNASPIGDLTAMFMALDAELLLKKGNSIRTIKLSSFYLAYKSYDLNKDEYIDSISFDINNTTYYNFEKVSKRKHLDIASVNTAISILLHKDKFVKSIHISCGGVGPTPLKLVEIESLIKGQELNVEIVQKAQKALPKYISPIGDIRGSKIYKTKLLQQLFLAHFITLFPDMKFELSLN